MATITYAGINHEVNIQCEQGSLLDISIDNQIPHLHECGGHGKCTTCRVRVLEGAKNLTQKTSAEKTISHKRRWDPSIRLACQCKPKGDITLQRLLWDSAQVSKLQKETVPEGKADERNIAILFCDLRNFTSIAEKNLAFDMAHMLNQFYTMLGDPIVMNNGIIYQYVGDEIIGVFGTAEGPTEKICEDALRAALGMRHAVERLNRLALKEFDTKFRIGIGINYGKAYVGYLGHPKHRQFSVIGDPVNVASRIQGQTKVFGTDLLVSQKFLDQLPEAKIATGPLHEVSLKGKSAKEKIVEVNGFSNMDLQLELQSSLSELLREEDQFASVFYDNLFKRAPFLKTLFTRNMKLQGRMLTHMLSGIVYSLSRPAHLEMGLRKLGQNHVNYGVKDEYYPIVHDVLLETIEEVLGSHFNDNVEKAWKQGLEIVIGAMKNWKN